MKLSHTDTKKYKYQAMKLLILTIGCIFISDVGCSKKAAKSSSESSILSIDLSKHSYRPGETLTAHVRIRNDAQEKAHFLVVLNVLYGDETVYDSHHGKKSHDHKGDQCLDTWIDVGIEQNIGPFVYQIPRHAKPGTYHVLAALRVYPWEPAIMFRGGRWCPPETTFELR